MQHSFHHDPKIWVYCGWIWRYELNIRFRLNFDAKFLSCSADMMHVVFIWIRLHTSLHELVSPSCDLTVRQFCFLSLNAMWHRFPNETHRVSEGMTSLLLFHAAKVKLVGECLNVRVAWCTWSGSCTKCESDSRWLKQFVWVKAWSQKLHSQTDC